MEKEYRNIYRRARKAAGLTQERWAEVLGISVDSVKAYETGKTIPPDEIALGMSEAAGQQIYCYWHLLNKSRAAAEILPELREKTLPEAVLSLLVRVQDFQRGGLQDLLRLAADGKIDQTETLAFGEALAELGELITAAYELQYAKGAE